MKSFAKLVLISAALSSSLSFAGSLYNAVDDFGHSVYCQALIMNNGATFTQQTAGALFENGLEYMIPGYCEDPHCAQKNFITSATGKEIETACQRGINRSLARMKAGTNLLSAGLDLGLGAITRTYVLVDGVKIDISSDDGFGKVGSPVVVANGASEVNPGN